MDYKQEYDKFSKQIKDAEYELETTQNLFALRKEKIITKYTDKVTADYNAGKITSEECASLKAHYVLDISDQAYFYQNLKFKYFKAPNDEARSVLNNMMKSCLKTYPELTELDEYIQQWWDLQDTIDFYKKELQNLKPTSDNAEPDVCQQMANVQENIKQDVEKATKMQHVKGHVYPVALVVNWTNQLKDINTKIDNYIKNLNDVSLQNVDKTWLRKQIEKFVNWINGKLQQLRQKIVNGLKAIYQDGNELLNTIAGCVPTSISLDTLPTWASSVISLFMKPYKAIILFITDFMTYTPPLITEAATVSAKVVSTPSFLTSKFNELEGEANQAVKEEISECVKEIKVEPITLGDIV